MTIPHWIDGRAHEGGGAEIDVFNPATGHPDWTVGIADTDVLKQALASASAAWPVWRDLPLARRAQPMYQFRDLLRAHDGELAAMITAQHGKTLDDALGEVTRGIEAVELACGAPGLLKGEMSEQTGSNIDTFSTLHPLGVGLGITPFNFPVMIPLMMAALAISSGNTFILKPSEQNPGPAILLAELATEAGFPPGVFNVVHGGRDVVEQLIDHPDIAAVSFVGSTPAAYNVYMRAASAGKRVQAMGGAKNHLVVMPDADLDDAADALSSAAFGSAGQRCMAITTAVAVGAVADKLAAKLAQRALAISIGDGAQSGVEMGPLVSKAAQDRVRGYLSRARDAGITVVIDRSTELVDGYLGGYYVGPTVLDHVTPEMEVYQEEIFGPVLSIVRTDTLDAALELIRVNPYGNGAAIFTRSGNAARKFQREASVGMVGINVPIPVPVAPYSVAGWKNSVFGDTGLNNGSWRFWTQPKYVTTRWAEPTGGVDLGFHPN